MTNRTISLTGQLPSGKNAVVVTRTGQRFPQARFKAWREHALRQLRPQLAGHPWLYDGPIHLIVDYVPGDRRRRDLPGMLDALCHLLEKAGVVRDDAQIQAVTWTSFPMDRSAAGCRMTLCSSVERRNHGH